jgi:hypothetical protein
MEQQEHRRKMYHQPQRIRQRMYIIHERYTSRQRHTRQQPWILESEKHAPYPKTNGEYNTAASQHNPRMRTSLIRFIYDVTFVGNTEVDEFSHQQKYCYN